MDLGYDGDLFLLAFDHRGSFKSKMFGIEDASEADTARLNAAKQLVWEGFESALAAGLPQGAGILVDEEMGATVARAARQAGVPFAMPVEKSGQDVFDFEYGDEFAAHIEEFDPTVAKVLVRWNPEDDPATKALQAERLSGLGTWLHDHDRLLLFELLVPASARQKKLAGGDADAYDRHIRPVLMLETIDELRQEGVEPDIWKIEGVDSPDYCRLIADLVRADGRDRVACVVLGRGADEARVDHWLSTAAPVPGYAGFAIGRSIWWDAVADWRDEKTSAADAATRIGGTYQRFIDIYQAAR
jgi:myo-inositol catabolism protein IolC